MIRRIRAGKGFRLLKRDRDGWNLERRRKGDEWWNDFTEEWHNAKGRGEVGGKLIYRRLIETESK